MITLRCTGCQTVGKVAVKTSGLRCTCGSTRFVEPGSEDFLSFMGVAKRAYEDPPGWNEYQGPPPGLNPISNDEPAELPCTVCKGTGKDIRDNRNSGDCRLCKGTGKQERMTDPKGEPLVARHPGQTTIPQTRAVKVAPVTLDAACGLCKRAGIELRPDRAEHAWLHCFSGDTSYVTAEGIRTFADTVGTVQQVLTSDGDPHEGRWVEAPIRYFGEQQIWEVTLRRDGQTRTFRTTSGHRWKVGRKRGAEYRWSIFTTDQLKPGHRLAHLRATRFVGPFSRDGVRQGAFFGDGTLSTNKAGPHDNRVYGVMALHGDKYKALEEFFSETCPTPAREVRPHSPGAPTEMRFYSGMKDWSKVIPSLDSSQEYLLGWLMGYMATDGSVAADGEVTISSAQYANLQHVRDIAMKLGIGTYPVQAYWRKGFGDEESPIYKVSLAASDFDPEFFLRESHRKNFEFARPKQTRLGWTVVSVLSTEDVEPVYCAVVPDTESFALVDNIWTMNCAACGPLVDLDARPEFNPYTHPITAAQRGYKTSGLRKVKATGRVLRMVSTVQAANPGLTDREVLGLVRRTVASYPEA